MGVSGPQRTIFVASVAVGIACLLLLDFVFVPFAYESDASMMPPDAAAPIAPSVAIASIATPEPSVRVTLSPAARVPTIVARFESEAKEPSDQNGIRALASAMIEDHGATIVLEGHSDTRGGDDYNHEISLARAEWVKARLVELGVSGERVETVGLGATRPLHSDVDAQASVNRRVEVRWLGR